MGRAPCCDKANVKKGPWSPEEDSKLKEYIEKHGTGGNWIALPQKAGLKRCGKSCRLRWLNYLRPNIKHGEFSEEEDRIICSLFANIGSRWSIIAAQLPGRTDNDIKNYWNTKLKKKLMGFVNPPNNYTYNSSQRKLPVVPFPNNNNIISSHHETTTTATTTTSASSSFSLPYHQPFLMSTSLSFRDQQQYYSNYSRSAFSSSSSGLEHQVYSNMMSSSTSNSTSGFSTNLSSSSLFQAQQDQNYLVGNSSYMQYSCYNYPLKESNNNLLMFGSEGSCSTSSDGSCNYQIKQEEMGTSTFHNQAYNYNIGNATNATTFDHHDQDHNVISQRLFMLNSSSCGGNNGGEFDNCLCLWGQKSNGYFGETPLDDHHHHHEYHVLEDQVKQLISSTSTSNSQGNNNNYVSNNSFNINTDENKTQEKVMYF